jgi:hypothetical protein
VTVKSKASAMNTRKRTNTAFSAASLRKRIMRELDKSARSGRKVTTADIDRLIAHCVASIGEEQTVDFFFMPNPWFNGGTPLAYLCYGKVRECHEVLNAWDDGVYL